MVQNANEQESDALRRPGDDENTLKTAAGDLEERFRRSHESDVAAGYFTVCREYTPSWFSSKSSVQPAPSGEPTTAESVSVYQTMYSSLFSRNQTANSKRAKTTNKTETRTSNLFFVVLRHGHLMLYDDSGQINVRYIISLAHYDVSIYSGGGEIPEEELWAKRNAIRLTRRSDSRLTSQAPAPPFYIFSENLSEKEDLYFAMLRNQEKMADLAGPSPTYISYDVKHIIDLLQRLYSSEEQRSTRWINAILGRLFLALYRTPEMEESVKRKIAKKISRAKTPNFITKLALRDVHMGEGAPFINNPRLRELTLDGDCIVGMDFSYTGNFRLEVSATVHIDLGTRFKPRDVDLVLAVMINRVDGHCLVRLKPPPSNRIWFTFEAMPTVTMSIEPIFGTRQITYGVVLRAIENRIREVISESVVLPFWDDIPFFDTSSHPFRGGIWKTRRLKADKETNVQRDTETGNDDSCKDSGRTSAGNVDSGHSPMANTVGTIDPSNSKSEVQSQSMSAHPQPQSSSDSLSSPLDTMDSFSSQIPSPAISTVAAGAADSLDTGRIHVLDISQKQAVEKQVYGESAVARHVLSTSTAVPLRTASSTPLYEIQSHGDIAHISSEIFRDKSDKREPHTQSHVSIHHTPSLSTSEVETSSAPLRTSDLPRRRNTLEFLPSSASPSLRERYQGMRFLKLATGTPRSWSWKMLAAKENMAKAGLCDNTTFEDKQSSPPPCKGFRPDDEEPILKCDLPDSGTEPAPLSLVSGEYVADEDLDENR
ncbi:hypothetical protein AOR_1_150084 [Paecilomyces variotii No. 5]|uniref:SMP-LTD domain-containing protein n=1 Tax=Byssochlamys spectabilis (strain No. 5 / NBRC 109023) TaxID=1356009 RepID=V5HS06_BYSSN|nr:hypothetical protein AOR_1_150084 [Paecilomyces variotii No. 5]